MSDKHIIKNCPAFMKPSYCKDKCSYSIANKRDGELTYKFEFDEDSKCQDCTNCVIKQIVEKCKKETRVYRNTLLPADGTNTIHFGRQSFAYDVLQLLDMQEVE